MTTVSRQAKVAYSAAQMFTLVNDIGAYPEFLSWCTATDIISATDHQVTASISVAFGKIKQTFTTANTIKTNRSITMQLVEGPFKELHGKWQFQADSDNVCVVSLDMQFEFKNRLLKLILELGFQRAVDSLVDNFIERAHFVYGTK